ncbi:pirin family protein [Acetobacteraceae bacterium ESL0709]|nr:pirin family protein [Acetobacteraceae bacterium ESL0697]MDF7678926.1 pirin family protein [Acetobacteraceae bacterium ESL0709]
MIEIRPYDSLGHAHHGWLKATHHFSFADYYDPARMGWGLLRVWNDDKIAPQSGFPPHPHKDMEIITYVRKGAITHRDDKGYSGKTLAGDVQVMSAGNGIIHSEYNLESEETLIFQIWILPDRQGHKPSWGSRPFPKAEREGHFVTLASGHEDDTEALRIQCHGRVMGATLKKDQVILHKLSPETYAYLVPAAGTITLNNQIVKMRDGAAIKEETELTITALEDCELVMVETRP